MNSNKKIVRVLFVCKKRLNQYGISTGLLNSARFTCNALNKVGIECSVVQVVDANGIDKEVVQYKPTHVIIEAIWIAPLKMKELTNLHKRVLWYVNIHSKIPFLAMEGMAIDWICRYNAISKSNSNFKLSANSTETVEDLNGSIDTSFVYLPNIYEPEDYQDDDEIISIMANKHRKDEEEEEEREDRKRKRKTIDIGCFGAIRPLKNQLIQGAAAIIFANDIGRNLNFHVNAGRLEQTGENVLKNLRSMFENNGSNALIEHPWISHREFIGLIRNMDLGTQVSYTETFNIVAADMVYNNIPIVVSEEINWMPKFFMADQNSTDSIVSKMKYAWNISKFGLHRLCKISLNDYNKKSLDRWLDEITCNR
mgnify:CR=1 FL=1